MNNRKSSLYAILKASYYDGYYKDYYSKKNLDNALDSFYNYFESLSGKEKDAIDCLYCRGKEDYKNYKSASFQDHILYINTIKDIKETHFGLSVDGVIYDYKKPCNTPALYELYDSYHVKPYKFDVGLNHPRLEVKKIYSISGSHSAKEIDEICDYIVCKEILNRRKKSTVYFKEILRIKNLEYLEKSNNNNVTEDDDKEMRDLFLSNLTHDYEIEKYEGGCYSFENHKKKSRLFSEVNSKLEDINKENVVSMKKIKIVKE